jgi:uncharacterized protein DUF4383
VSNASVRRDRRGPHPSQILALVIAAAYTLIGVAGFAVTGLERFARVTGETLLGFEINPLHNILHLVVGVLGLIMVRRLSSARGYGLLLAATYGVTLLYGFVAVRVEELNILSLNGADNWLHAASVLVGLAIALWPSRATAPRGTRPVSPV